MITKPFSKSLTERPSGVGLAALATTAALCASTPAEAACPSDSNLANSTPLTCSSTISGRVSVSDTNHVDGTYTCGDPYGKLSGLSQDDVYKFT